MSELFNLNWNLRHKEYQSVWGSTIKVNQFNFLHAEIIPDRLIVKKKKKKKKHARRITTNNIIFDRFSPVNDTRVPHEKKCLIPELTLDQIIYTEY